MQAWAAPSHRAGTRPATKTLRPAVLVRVLTDPENRDAPRKS